MLRLYALVKTVIFAMEMHSPSLTHPLSYAPYAGILGAVVLLHAAGVHHAQVKPFLWLLASVLEVAEKGSLRATPVRVGTCVFLGVASLVLAVLPA